MSSRKKDPKPEICRIEELVSRVKDGDIKLPKFQRVFVWKKNSILNLCDSVYQGYPIGSILLWITTQRLESERSIGDLDINTRSEEYPVNYLLDGQQRLSSLCGVLYWNGNDPKSNWNVWFDLDKEKFFYPSEEPKDWHFPMNRLLDTFDFIEQCKRFEHLPKKEKFERTSKKLLNSIKDYKIATITIGDMSIEEVTPIFERINSTGTKLTIADLMRAVTWSESFDLTETINSIKERLRDKGFSGITDTEILKSVSAINGGGILKDDISKLRDLSSKELEKTFSVCENSYERVIDFFSNEIIVPSYNMLPYSIQLTYLAEFFKLCPSPSIHQASEIKRWFWHTSFSSYFGSASYSILRESLSDIRGVANTKTESFTFEKPLSIKPLDEEFTFNKAFSKAFALMLLNRRPMCLLNGASISASAISYANKSQYHHIFPRSYLSRQNQSKSKINCHANYCILPQSANVQISDKRPSDYFKEIVNDLGDKVVEILASNFIDEKALEACLRDDFDSFVQLRRALLFAEIERLAKS